MNIFLAPAKKENLALSIENSINADILIKSNFTHDEIEFIKNNSQNNIIHAWAINNNNNMKSYIKNIKKNDIVLFCDTSIKKFIYSCQVLCLIKNDFINSNLWDKDKTNSNSSNWSNIIFVTNVKKLNPPISKNEIMLSINSKYTLQTFYRLKESELKIFITKFNELISFVVDTTYISKQEIVEEHKSSSNNINDLKNYINNTPNINLNLNPIKIGLNKNNSNFSSPAKSIDSDTLNSNEKKLIGWIGEKFAYDYIMSNLKSILLSINKSMINPKVHWFNKSVNIYYDFWIDQSIGKGYDIEIKNKNDTLKFEVKTSFNRINQVTFTSNELLKMKNSLSKQNYFIIFISNLKNIMFSKSIDFYILKNFATEISSDYIFYSKSHTLYAQELLKTYKILISK